MVVPNPYVGINELEPVSKLPGQVRGERRIYFVSASIILPAILPFVPA